MTAGLLTVRPRPGRARHLLRAGDTPLLIAGAISAVLAAAAVSAQPVIGLALGLGPIALVLLVRSSIVRLAWFIGGGLLVLQASNSVGGPKLAYLAGVLLVAAVSSRRVVRSQELWLQPFRPILLATAGVGVLLLFSAVIAAGQSAPLDWLRDVFSYALFAVAPIIALDAAHDVGETHLHRLIAALGVLTAVGFTVDWLQRRGVSSLPFGRFILASGCPAGLAIALAVAKVAARQGALRWGTLAVVIPSIMLTTGTRSVLINAAALVSVLGRRSRQRMGLIRASILCASAVGAVALILPRLVALLGNSVFFKQRMAAAIAAIHGGRASDASYQSRQVSYQLAQRTWADHRWIGTGPGHQFLDGAFTLDSPLATLVKWGIIGTAILVGFAALIIWRGNQAGRRFGWSPAHTAMRGFTLVMLAFIPFGSPVEDKGFAFGVCLAVCAVAVAARTSVGEQTVANEVAHNPTSPGRSSSNPAAAGSAKYSVDTTR